MAISSQRKYRKTVETLLYISGKENRTYWVLKMIWLAERSHLSKYGSMIIGDDYIAMSHGPVPSLAYDIVKDAQGVQRYDFDNPIPGEVFDAPTTKLLRPRRGADQDVLSDSEKECLEEAYKVLHPLSFGKVKKLSHTPAQINADQNDAISLEEFAKDLENGDEVLEYLASL